MASLINGFLFKKVDLSDKNLMEMIYRLRFEVYARQRKFIREDDYPLESESDEYDNNSVHFAAINPRGMLVATARIILSDQQSSPLLKFFPHLPSQLNFESESIVEISRFMICKKSRHSIFQGDDSSISFNSFRHGINRLPAEEDFPKNFSPNVIVQGLCQEIYNETQRRGIKYWCALMEKSLWSLLSKYGLKFQCVGDHVNVLGPVRPYIGNIADFNSTKLVTTSPEDPEERILRILRGYSTRHIPT